MRRNLTQVIQQKHHTATINQTDFGTLIAQGTSVGSWQLLSYQSPILPIHAALLRTGNVFFFAGSSNNPTRLESPGNSVVWNVSNGTFSSQAAPTDSSGLPVDIFCAGQSFRSDGRLMIAGGTLKYDTSGPFKGATAAFLFNPTNQQLRQVASMNSGRWYPTVLTLGNGRIFALSGLDINGNLSVKPEIYSSSAGWRAFSQQTSYFDLYAHLFLLATGQIFYSGAYFSSSNGVTPRLLNLPGNFNQAIAETSVGALPEPDSAGQAASILLPPAQDQKVMVIGGGDSSGNATKRVSIIDLKQSNPSYGNTQQPPQPTFARMHHNAVLLPDRTVFVCNGSAQSENGSQAARTAEIYDPINNTWTVAATAQIVRLYHSIALLLPDGRVLAAGGNPRRLNECDSSGNLPGSNPVIPCEEKRLEIYSPPYISSSTRPVINNAPQSASYNSTFTIQTPQAANIQWVSLIKPMATTHGLDTEQRLVDLPITARNGSSLTVSVTNNRNIAPAGYYMLFISDNSRVPSVARWIRLG
jgi:hypothetical protein